MCQQGHSGTDEERGEPAAAVYVFFKEDFGGGSVADEGQGGAGWSGERDINFAEGEEQREEAERHAQDS